MYNPCMKVDLHAKNILIVDDNKVNVLFLDAMLEDLDYISIFSASSAKEAYKIMQTKSIDLLLLDVIMPEIDGLEACKHIRTELNHPHVPIIMVTADTSDETIVKSFEVGASDYISKPINKTNLRVRVHSALMGAYKDALIHNQNRLLAVNETVQMLAHQWRQPLALINSTAIEMSLSYEFEALTQDKLDSAIFKINDAVHTLSSTLDDFSKISKNESEASLLKIRSTVGTSVNLIRDRLEANNIQVKTQFLDTIEVRYFHNEMIKILIAIYTNTIEAFSRNEKKENRQVLVSTKQTKNSTFIVIADNAGGVDESILPRIFEPYVSIKAEKNGVGLGLYNAYNTLKKSMKASIKIKSHDFKTVVTIELPNS